MSITSLYERSQENWLIGYDTNQLNFLIQESLQQLTQLSQNGKTPTIFLAQSDPLKFVAGFLAGVMAKCPLFLCNPRWIAKEWQQVLDLVQPDLVWGENLHLPPTNPLQNRKEQFFSGKIMIPTGGSSGKIRFTIHTWETLSASVKGFQSYFGAKAINSCCVLPLYHVSGLMQFLRSFLTGGRLLVLPYKALKAGVRGNIDPKEFYISLVPTQLQYLLTSYAATWLSQFQTVLLGGAPPWQELLAKARLNNISLALTYGMTETASQIVTLKPEDFLAGNNSCGRILPHTKVKIFDREGQECQVGEIGIITIQAESVCLGYYPQPFSQTDIFQPDDLGYFDQQGYLHIVGRCSKKIITGGEKVYPNEVEAAIYATRLVEDVCVIGLADSYWGQAVTAVYVPRQSETAINELKGAIANQLSKFKQPKYWLATAILPRNAQGKVNYEQVKELAQECLVISN
ncbi:MAG: 2-succinylbenzoate--CoA ligase [Spirulinaceae cyanobacterium]